MSASRLGLVVWAGRLLRQELGSVFRHLAERRLSPGLMVITIPRNAQGNRGEVFAEDRKANEFYRSRALRLQSMCRARADTKFWGITETKKG